VRNKLKIMKDKIIALKNPASIIGGLLLIFIGAYIAMASQFSIGKKDAPAKEMPAYARISLGIFILLIGVIILFNHVKKQD
jgi:hypothetical protein